LEFFVSATVHALVLNADYNPLKVVPWQTAVLMVLDEKADLITEYVGRLVRSASSSMPWPAVIRLRKFVQLTSRLRFNRQNVLARDGYTCGYCGVRPLTKAGRPNIEELTLDHVIPRAHSKNGIVLRADGRKISVTCWENIICACVACNMSKADRTPAQAGMKLRIYPKVPTSLDMLRMTLTKVRIPEEWAEYLPKDSVWRGYWTEELDPD
jgi:5-methylcytosine-specific restriction endonuclease McrA